MSPIYVRPEREQAEHDRLIRFLQAKYSKKFEALINPGDERTAPVKLATMVHFPDLVLNEDGRLAGLVEIETAASVNNLETMAKWVPYSRARVPFHLYVPVQGYEATLRLAAAHQVKAAEIWTYRPAVEGFDLVRMFVDASLQASKASKAAKAQAAAPVRPVARAEAARPSANSTKKVAKAAVVPKAPVKAPAKAPAKPAAKAAAKSAAKPKAAPVRRSAAPKRPAKPVRTSSRPAARGKAVGKAAAKGVKTGAGSRKGR